MQKKAMLVAGAVSLGVAGLAGLSTVSAQSGASSDSLIDKLASRFNLNKDEVQAVFDEERSERQAEHQAEFSERLQEKVDDGDITAEQKTLIEEKMKQIQAAMETERDQLEAWAEGQGIDVRYLFGGHRGGDRLDDAAKDSDITAEQQAAIEAKRDELETKRHTARDILEQWAEDNDIDLDLLHDFRGGHGPGGPGGPGQM